MNEHDDAFDDDIEWVSKSEMKREMHKLQDLAERLLNVKKSDLKDFDLNDGMLEAIEEASRIKSHEARRRHLQYMGKLVRDEDIELVQRRLDIRDPSSELFLRLQNQAEKWRERLIRTADAEGLWIKKFPEIEIQPFRAVIRAAKKEQDEDPKAPIKAGKNTKKLLQIIRVKLFA